MNPGIFPNLSWDEYLAIDAVSRSQLLRLFHSPAAFKHAEEREETLAMKGGTYTHMAVLEPERFESTVAVMPRFHGGMKDENAVEKGYDGGREAKAEWLAEHEGLEVIEGSVRDESLGIANAVHRCEAARVLLEGEREDSEVTVVWDDVAHGVRCKARLDRLFDNMTGGMTIVDLKRTHSVRPATFFNSTVPKMRLHIQDAFYTRGVQTIRGVTPDPIFGDGYAFAFVAFEPTPPHHAAVFELGGSTRELANRELDRMLEVVRWCQDTGNFPDYSTHVHSGELPMYYDEFQYPEDYADGV